MSEQETYDQLKKAVQNLKKLGFLVRVWTEPDFESPYNTPKGYILIDVNSIASVIRKQLNPKIANAQLNVDIEDKYIIIEVKRAW